MRKNWKKAMAGTLSVCMLATGVSGVGELGELVHKSNVVYAATTENVVSGECGDKATRQYDKQTKTLTISGSGDMKSYYVDEDVDAKPWEDDDNKIIDNRPWAVYKNEIREVVVEDEITKIGQDAFLGCISLEKVKLGKM